MLIKSNKYTGGRQLGIPTAGIISWDVTRPFWQIFCQHGAGDTGLHASPGFQSDQESENNNGKK